MTGSPAVLTATLRSVPPAAVTVIPGDGLAPLAPLPGVIVTTGPAGDGRAEGAADRPAGPDPPAPVYSMMVVVLPVQAATVSVSAAPAATAESARITLMPTPYLLTY